MRAGTEEGNEKGEESKRQEREREREGVGKREKEGRRPTGPLKVPRRQQRASNELIKLSNSFGLASERANKCSPLPRGPLHCLSSTIRPSYETLSSKFMHVPRSRYPRCPAAPLCLFRDTRDSISERRFPRSDQRPVKNTAISPTLAFFSRENYR